MRTLALLVAVLLLTLPAQGEPLRESTDEGPAQEDPEPQDQDVNISFAEDGNSTREVSGLWEIGTCYCTKRICKYIEHKSGNCIIKGGILQRLCCHKTALDSI